MGIDKIPQDPFTSKDVTYRLVGKGYVMYSFSRDQKDGGGPGPDSNDIGFRVPLAPPVLRPPMPVEEPQP
ncbi:MAG: hypothetical protein ACRC8S_06730 [Fimbriiglobus sp.]